MDAHQHANLGKVLAYLDMADEERKAHVQAQRDRLASTLRAARVRVKANKAAHGGIYEA